MKHNCNAQIWQVVDSRAYGGIESHIYYLSTALAAQGRDVCVIFLNDYGDHPLWQKLREAGVHIIKCAGMMDFYRLVTAFHPAIMHSHGYKANLAVRVAGVMHGIPSVATYHAGDCETLRLKLYTTLDRVTACIGDAIAVNDKIAKTVFGGAQVIDNFVPVPRERCGKIVTADKIGFVGRLSYEKAPDRFLDLAARCPDKQFHIFGDGPMAESLQVKAPQNIRFHGHMGDMEEAWRHIDILCMPSRKEGLPLAALEAMARGIPVLAYAVGALPKLITHGENGWILPVPKGNKNSSADDMRDILKSIEAVDVATCGHHARQTIIKNYAQGALLPHFIALYDRLLSKYYGGRYATS